MRKFLKTEVKQSTLSNQRKVSKTKKTVVIATRLKKITDLKKNSRLTLTRSILVAAMGFDTYRNTWKHNSLLTIKFLKGKRSHSCIIIKVTNINMKNKKST